MTHKIAHVTEYRADGRVIERRLTREEVDLYRCPEIGCRVSIAWISTQDAAGAIPITAPSATLDGLDGTPLDAPL